MREFTTLAFVPDFFGVGAAKFAARFPDGKTVNLQADEVSALIGPVVSFETNTLVDQLQSIGRTPPALLIEIGDALKLRAGRSKSDGGMKDWDFWRELHRGSHTEHSHIFTKELFFSKVLAPPEVDIGLFLRDACEMIFQVWKRNIQLLKDGNEYERFMDLEVQIQKIFFRRQAAGLKINQSKTREFIEAAKAEKYKAYISVANALQVSPTGLTYRNIGRYLERTDASHLEQFCNSVNIEEHFKIAAEGSKFAKDFIRYMRASHDVNTLNRMMGSTERIYPFFHVMGTVTGRILVSEPHIQHLRKCYRNVISSDDGYVLAYLDYRQFEPGIIAHISGDKKFIEAYNESDLYTSLGQAVFGGVEHRKLCKRVFLAFCYGMTKEGLVTLLAGSNPADGLKEELAGRLNKFFAEYPGLERLKIALENSLMADGYIASLWGNRRYRVSSGHLDPSEKRWSISQRVQGTASLIFKEALVDIANDFSSDCILLPMHDAVLLQFPEQVVDQMKERAAKIMTSAFSRRCPTISPRIADEPFGE